MLGPIWTLKILMEGKYLRKTFTRGWGFYPSPGPMSKIISDSRVRVRGFTTIASNSSYASDSYFTYKASNSDS